MKTATHRLANSGLLARAAAFCLLALALTLLQAREARAQWTSGGGATSTADKVGIGTSTPIVPLQISVPSGDVITRFVNAGGAGGGLDIRYKLESSQHRMGLTDGNGQWMFYTQYAPSNANSFGFFPGRVGVGTETPLVRLDVQGAANVWGGARYAVSNGYMAQGSLTLGNVNANFGGGSGWSGNTAGLMLEASDNTEIAVHDYGTRLASFMFFEGASANRLTIGRDMGFGAISTVNINGNVGIGTNAPAAKLDVQGDIRVSGNINAKYQDVAEWVPSKQKLQAGTVVVLDTAELNHVQASARSYDTGVAGVVSAQPGISLGEAGDGKLLVATTGRVKVKADATRGAIKVGDLLVTSDVAGVAMRSQPLELGGVPIHRPGTIIGKALEPLAGGTGEILVLLSLQ